MARLISLSVLLLLILFLGGTFFRVLAPLLLPLFVAAVMAILFQPLLGYFVKRCKGRKRLAAGLTTGTILSMILLPLLVGTLVGALQLFVVVTDYVNSSKFDHTIESIKEDWNTDSVVSKIEDWIGIEAPVKENAADDDSASSDSGADARQGDSSKTDEAIDQTEDSSKNQLTDKNEPEKPADAIPGNESSTETTATESQNSENKEDKSESESNADTEITAEELAQQEKQEQKKELISVLTEIGAPDARLPVENQDSDGVSPEKDDNFSKQFAANVRTTVKGLVQKTWGLAGVAAGAAPRVAFGLLDAIVTGLISSLMFVIALYYFLADGPALLTAAEGLIPMAVDYQRELINRFEKVVRAVVMATFLAAIAQGITTALALQFLGFGHFFFFAVVGTLASMIPLAGTWIVWGPCAIHLLSEERYGSATLLILFGIVVIGMMDNVIRTYVLQSDIKLHPLLAFVSVMGGLQVMGLWGVFIGPMVASVLHALIQIFNFELKRYVEERTPQVATAAAAPETLPPGRTKVLDQQASDEKPAKPKPAKKKPNNKKRKKN